ncbi:lytic transglycosylase domain-containing protein [Yersinia hibernica]|uniref:Type III secretion system protein n=1 Tax=Yersinia enterocolitica LC20 TaxID=1443113 RepID=A0A7U4K0F9_YEREN|nr:lytic transglycosylase domain-containing protein [Yersinia hibernica]AHM72774.1 type III secretion system protein [Yersinia hibernica]OVZ78291.1 type III secretion system protein [Yersinia kristensenii]
MKIKSFTPIAITLSMLLSPFVAAQKVDCIAEAAQCFQINPLVIKAIIWQESKNRQQAINRNKNSTVDVGIMQINTVHFAALKALGIDETLLHENSCANVFSGTWVLKQNIERYGYTWDGIGNYHSKTPVHHDKYVKKIISLIAHQTSVIDKIEVTRQEGIRERFTCR